MTVLEAELDRLLTLSRERKDDPITEHAVAAAWVIAYSVPWAGGGARTDGDPNWSCIAYPGGVGLDVSIESYGDVEFDFDRGQNPHRFMLSLFATQTGEIGYALYTPFVKHHGVLGPEGVTARLSELFQQFTDS